MNRDREDSEPVFEPQEPRTWTQSEPSLQSYVSREAMESAEERRQRVLEARKIRQQRGSTIRPERLATSVVAWQLLFSSVTALALYKLPSFLLLLKRPVADAAAASLTIAVLLAGCFGVAQGWSLVFARRRLLDNLQHGSRSLSHSELPKLNDDPWRIANAWVISAMAAVTLSMTLFRPSVISPQQAVTLTLFAGIIIAAASLPLLMLVRRDFVRAMERVPPDIMAEVIDSQVRRGQLRGRTSRRLLAAIVTPVAFLAIGSALIAGAHLRSSDTSMHRRLGRLALESTLSEQDSQQDVETVLGALEKSGYQGRIVSAQSPSDRQAASRAPLLVSVARRDVALVAPEGRAGPLGWLAIPVALATLGAALWVGLQLGRLLSSDLRMANHGVRMLGTDAALEGTRVMKPARFRAVAELGHSIELLASRFRMFANAQERSITARESATSARGRFFASVSHDLKSPLNAILGFAALCQQDPITNRAQRESLDLIVNRGRELLALIETILDAARVEAGQLQLEITEERIETLLELAIDKARQLDPESHVLVMLDLPEDPPTLSVDRQRFAAALASFIEHARRTAERSSVRLLVDVPRPKGRPSLRRRKVFIHVEVPSQRFSARELAAMLSPERHPGQHRGVALTLRLAKGIVELHGGKVKVTGRTVSEPAFAVEIRGRPGT